jgi:cytochrome c553
MQNRRRLSSYFGVASVLVIGLCVVAVFASHDAVGRVAAETPPAPGAAGSAQDWQAYLDKNCSTCHSQRGKAGGLVLEKALLAPVGSQADVWEKVVLKLGNGEMPPPSVKNRPDAHQSAAFVAFLTKSLDEYALANPDAGRPTVRRLTRVEYSNAVRDIFGVDLKPGDSLPPDVISNGFNNSGDALSLSPLLLEKYMSAARRVTRLATGDVTLPRAVYTFETPERQDYWQAGLPFGARGMPATEHYFPVAGEYVVRVFTDLTTGGRLPETEGTRFFQQKVSLKAGPHRISAVVPEEGAFAEGPIPDIPGWGGGLGGPLDPQRTATKRPLLDIRVDGKRVARFQVNPPTVIEAGTPTTVSPGAPWIRRMEVDGPYNPAGAGVTASRQRIFACNPATQKAEPQCAERLLTQVLRRAYRREVTSQDVQPFMAIYAKARQTGNFEGGVQQALQGILVSPGFLFRVEQDPEKVKAGDNYLLNDQELASRLSFFLWSSIPDDRLLDLAKAKRLKTPAVLEGEIRRMLADPKAGALVDNFGMQLLGLQGLDASVPDKILYPTFSTTLRSDLAEEARLFLREVMLGNKSMTELVSANYSYLNERLAKHYGVKGVYGPEFRRVTFDKSDVRGGVLGFGAVALVTSHSNMTSPVYRGKWVLSNLLNQPPSPPPPGIPALVLTNPSGRRLTGREQMEQHRTSPVCSSCHARMDPFGFAMENFDVTGAWRVKDEGGPVNAAVTMPDGSAFTGVVGLKQRLMSRQDDMARAMIERLMIYAVGRRLSAADAPTVRRIASETKADGYRFTDLILEIVKSDQFRMRRKASDHVL